MISMQVWRAGPAVEQESKLQKFFTTKLNVVQ